MLLNGHRWRVSRGLRGHTPEQEMPKSSPVHARAWAYKYPYILLLLNNVPSSIPACSSSSPSSCLIPFNSLLFLLARPPSSSSSSSPFRATSHNHHPLTRLAFQKHVFIIQTHRRAAASAHASGTHSQHHRRRPCSAIATTAVKRVEVLFMTNTVIGITRAK
jgi:hypothetical protein